MSRPYCPDISRARAATSHSTWKKRGVVLADDLGRGVAEHLLGALVIERDPALGVDRDDGHLRGGIEHGLEAFARAGDLGRALDHAALQLVAGAFLVVDVVAIADPLDDRAVLVAHRRGAGP